jgi:hypothetical protein
MNAYPGLTPVDIDNMDNITQQLLQAIINTRNHMAKIERDKADGGPQGKSMLPDGVVFQGENAV